MADPTLNSEIARVTYELTKLAEWEETLRRFLKREDKDSPARKIVEPQLAAITDRADLVQAQLAELTARRDHLATVRDLADARFKFTRPLVRFTHIEEVAA